MNPLFLILSLGGSIFCLAGYIQKKYPPKKINHLYGYRTQRSMKNIEVWNFAQKHAAQEMIKTGIIILLMAFLSWFFGIESYLGVWIGIGILTAFPLFMFWQIESLLKKKFSEDKKS